MTIQSARLEAAVINSRVKIKTGEARDGVGDKPFGSFLIESLVEEDVFNNAQGDKDGQIRSKSTEKPDKHEKGDTVVREDRLAPGVLPIIVARFDEAAQGTQLEVEAGRQLVPTSSGALTARIAADPARSGRASVPAGPKVAGAGTAAVPTMAEGAGGDIATTIAVDGKSSEILRSVRTRMVAESSHATVAQSAVDVHAVEEGSSQAITGATTVPRDLPQAHQATHSILDFRNVRQDGADVVHPVLVRRIAELNGDGGGRVQLLANPPELGPVGIDMSVVPGGAAYVVIETGAPDSHRQLAERLPALERSLSEMGLAVHIDLRQGDPQREQPTQWSEFAAAVAAARDVRDEASSLAPASPGVVPGRLGGRTLSLYA